MNFLSLLPPETRLAVQRRIEAEQREAARLFALPDRWLGAELLKLARGIRSQIPDLGMPNMGTGYSSFLLWDCVPAIAQRLGCPLQPNEAQNRFVCGVFDEDLRMAVGNAYANIDSRSLEPAARPSQDLCPVSFLIRSPANGSPLAIGLDRACPPTASSRDALAGEVEGAARARGFGKVLSWSPELNDPKALRMHADKDDLTEAFAPSPKS